jgi:hypothetical protein
MALYTYFSKLKRLFTLYVFFFTKSGHLYIYIIFLSKMHYIVSFDKAILMLYT